MHNAASRSYTVYYASRRAYPLTSSDPLRLLYSAVLYVNSYISTVHDIPLAGLTRCSCKGSSNFAAHATRTHGHIIARMALEYGKVSLLHGSARYRKFVPARPPYHFEGILKLPARLNHGYPAALPRLGALLIARMPGCCNGNINQATYSTRRDVQGYSVFVGTVT